MGGRRAPSRGALLDADEVADRFAGRRVYLDTNVFIYLLGASEKFGSLCLALLQACSQRRILGVTGDVTLAELLVKPLQSNNAAAVEAVRDLLIEDGCIALVSHTRRAFEQAAALRAAHGLKMVDALQLATAQEVGAGCLISNGRQFPALRGLATLSLEG